MKRKYKAGLLAAALSVCLVLPAAAAPDPEAQVIRTIQALGIMAGDQNGSMDLDAPVTRAQFATMAVKATPGGDKVGRAASSPFPDVRQDHWAAGYVEAAVARHIISGYTDGSFRPDRTVTLAEGASMALTLLGYGPADYVGGYPEGQLAKYRSLDLDRDVPQTDPRGPMTRRDAMYLFYNLMTAPTKAGTPYLTTLGHTLTPAGDIDLTALMNRRMEGPILAQGDYAARIPFPLEEAQVYRNGKPASPDQILPMDLIYYNEGLNALWVCSDKVTGTIQALSPSPIQPSALTLAGRTLSIETAQAAHALSDVGDFHVGDLVTVLLGRSGGVAAVVRPEEASFDQVGLVTAITSLPQTDHRGESYQCRTALVLTTDGQTWQYPCDRYLEVGDVVRVTADTNGVLSLKEVRSTTSGTFSADGTMLGRTRLAQDVEILEVRDSTGQVVYPHRLAGVTLDASDVLFCSTNAAGEISRLILKDVTGDLWQFGILTHKASNPQFSSYELLVDGTPVLIPQSNTTFPAEQGPIRVFGSLQHPEKLHSLHKAGSGEVLGQQLMVNGRSWPLSETAAVYRRDMGRYEMTTLALAQEQGLRLTGWYDKTPDQGGRIRILIAE